MKGSCTTAQESSPQIRYCSGAGWRSRGWKQTEGKGDEIKLDVYLGFRAGKVSLSLSFPGPRRRDCPRCSAVPSHNRHKAASPLIGGPGTRDSFWECLTGVEWPLLPDCNQNLFCRNHLSLKPYPLLQKWSVNGLFWKYFPLKGGKKKSWSFISVFPFFLPFAQRPG